MFAGGAVGGVMKCRNYVGRPSYTSLTDIVVDADMVITWLRTAQRVNI